MNYFQPRQIDPKGDRPDAGRWRYTCMNDGAVWPVGNCQTCKGHDTKNEAYDHQSEYELDNARFTEGPEIEGALSRYECESAVGNTVRDGVVVKQICEALTTSSARVGPGISQSVWLCTQHLNREGLANAWDGPGNVISS